NEELFDVTADPHEVNNLANDPAYADKLQELRGVLDNWVATSKDTGMMPEPLLIDSLWGAERVQPVVAAPVLSVDNGQLTMTCETPGASIGYRMTNEEGPAWQVYTRPIAIEPEQQITAVADRIGWVRSSEVSWDQ
ncbi:MAG: chitobiase/beta-hexosaminidase C-terminal domain-containing protein, partial [Bacteroidota bacterium]